MSGAGPRDVLIRQVDPAWYPLALPSILAPFLASARGDLPTLAGLFAVFLSFFWLFSFDFALYSKLRTPKEPRQ